MYLLCVTISTKSTFYMKSIVVIIKKISLILGIYYVCKNGLCANNYTYNLYTRTF